MNSKKNFISLSSEKIVNKINDLVIGDDSNDYLIVNSETRFHSDVNVGGSSIRLHSSDDTNPNNFISILDQNIHSVHAKTLREIQDLKIGDNNGKYLKFDDTSGLVASTVSGGSSGGGGGSGIVNNRIDGDLTIGEDDSEMLTIASKLHIPGGESGQVLTKGTDGSIEYGPTAFPSVSIPSSGGHLIDNVTITGNSQNVTLDMGADYADYEYFEVIGVNVVSDTDGYLLWRGKKVSDNSFDTTETHYGHSIWTLGTHIFVHDWGINNKAEHTAGPLGGAHAISYESPGPHNFRLFIYGLNKNAPTSSDYTVVGPHNFNNENPYKITGGTWQPSLTSNYIICNKIVFDTTANDSSTLGNLTSGTLLLYGYKTSGTTFTTANPLLANPSTADKGKIVTVNSAGDNLQYGPQVLKHNMNFKNIFEHGSFQIPASDANDNPAVHPAMNISITPQLTTSKIMIIVNIMGEIVSDRSWDTVAYLRKTINGVSTDILPPQDSQNIKGNRGLGQFVRTYHLAEDDTTMEVCNFHYIDEPNTISNVTYEVLIVCAEVREFKYNRTGSHDKNNNPMNSASAEFGMSFMSAEEKFANDDGSVGAITSFTQEQALAGAGGTAGGTPSVTNSIPYSNPPRGADKIFDGKIGGGDNDQWVTDNTVDLTTVEIAYEFNTPQIVTKYRLWPRNSSNATSQSPSAWELRAATDSSTYISETSSTYTLLDVQSGLTSSDWNNTISNSGLVNAADNLAKANEYNLSKIGAYKYYVIKFTAGTVANPSDNTNNLSLSEVAFYGGGFTIPSQVGHSGRLLTTDGTSLGWSTTSALPSVTVPEPTSTNKGRALVSTGTGIEFSDFNSGVSTGFKVYKSGTAFEEVTGGNAVLFDQTTINVGAGSYSTTAGTYTVPVTGYYNIFANFEKLDVGFSCDLANDISFSGPSAIGHHTITNWLLYSSGDIIPSYNINNNFNLSTGVFTSPCDGYYQANANIRIDGMSHYFRIYFSVNDQDNAINSGTGHNIAGNPATNWESLMSSQIIFLKKNNTLRVKIYSYSDDNWVVHSESSWSMHLIEQKSEFVLQKSTNSGTSYTDIKKAKNNLSETVYLNQNDLIRITSDSTNKLTFNQGELNNSFGAHLLNSGNSTSPIPIYGFSVDLTSDNNSLSADATITGWNYTGANEFALPTANFNGSSGIYTIPISGYYDIKVSAKTSSNVDGIYLSVNNGTDSAVTNLFRIKESSNVVSGSANVKLLINDTIRLKVEAAGNVLSSDTHWSCFLLASDTQTNTRQMGLSPIVPLHQLGHDQFAEGVVCRIDAEFTAEMNINIELSANDDTSTKTVDQMGTITPGTVYKLSSYNDGGSNYAISYIRNGGSPSLTVPSPVWSDSNWTNSTSYILIKPQLTSDVDHDFYTIGSVTIDASKLLENYIGWWLIRVFRDNGVRLKINNESFSFLGHNTGSNQRSFNLFQKYINIEYMHVEGVGGDQFYFEIYRAASVPGLEIAEPVMPSITLPTPNSNNNGKVLVSNGSGYALENSGARNQSYIAITGLTGTNTLTTSETLITTWDTDNLINIGNNFTYNSGKITLKNTGKYRIKCILTFSISSSTSNNQRYGQLKVYINNNSSYNSTTPNEAITSIVFAEGTANYDNVVFDRIINVTDINAELEFKVHSGDNNNQASLSNDRCNFIIEDMTPSAVPSINVPLPVAAHAGKSLTVNSAGTGLEYGNPGVILQVQHARVTGFEDIVNIANISDSAANITGLSINFTPKQSSSKILLTAMINSSQTFVTTFGFKRDGSVLATPSGNNDNSNGSISTTYDGVSVTDRMYNNYIEWLDNANGTNMRTYNVAACSSWGSQNHTLYINTRSGDDMASFSSMTIYEIAQ